MYELQAIRLGRGRPMAMELYALAAVALSCVVAAAQIRYTSPVQQDGRLLDANPQIGSTRFNYARPVSPLIAGNSIVSGNVRGGLAFQGYSPIDSPTTFRGQLGSSALSAFRRDSVSVADAVGLLRGPLGSPYYDPSTTAYTGGFLTGQYNQPFFYPGGQPLGTISSPSPTGAGGPLDMRLDLRLPIGPIGQSADAFQHPASLRSQIVGATAEATPEMSSSIFGPVLPRPPDLTTNVVAPDAVTNLTDAAGQLGLGLARRNWYEGLGTDEPPGARPALGTPLDLVRGGYLQRLPLEGEELFPGLGMQEPSVRLGTQPPAVRTEEERPPELPPVAEPGPLVTTPPISDPTVLPGFDVFNDMQLALALAEDPGALWFENMQAAIRADPTLAESLQEAARVDSQQFIDTMLNTPVRSFVGRGDSALNDELLKAESLLEIGQYYEAVRRYEAAQVLAPYSPLPLVGKGHALLAAGEYMRAAVALVQGLERYPELVKFDLDLTALIGGPEVVDIRRANLMQLLERQDDSRLRFLLGYLEYYTGQRESGLANLDRAAAGDRTGSIIARFSAMLRGEAVLPPPKLPGPAPAEPPAPTEPQTGPDVPAELPRRSEGR